MNDNSYLEELGQTGVTNVFHKQSKQTMVRGDAAINFEEINPNS